MSNVYYDPQDFGLEAVGTVELAEPNYSFDFGVVWFHRESGRFYFATDSGCSCPTPFEGYRDLDSLGKPMTYPELASHLRTLKVQEWGTPPNPPVAVQVSSVLSRARSITA